MEKIKINENKIVKLVLLIKAAFKMAVFVCENIRKLLINLLVIIEIQ
ncbi:hypothetical protein [Clostridium perfringens]